MASKPEHETQADLFFGARRKLHGAISQEATREQLEAMAETPAGRAQLESFESNPVEAERYAARVAFSQLSASFASLFSIGFDESALLSAGARPGPSFEVRLEPEARLREYESVFGALARSFFTPDAIEELGESLTRSQTYVFADGSVIALTHADPASRELSRRLVGSAGSYAELTGDKDSRIAEIALAFNAMSAQINSKLSEHLERLSQRELRSILEEFSFNTIKSISTLGVAAIPCADLDAVANHVLQRHAEGPDWKPGASVSVNGIAAEDPAAFNEGLGAAPMPDARGLIERLRSSGVAQARAQANGSAPSGKKPKNPSA